jgi:hypothetical protein
MSQKKIAHFLFQDFKLEFDSSNAELHHSQNNNPSSIFTEKGLLQTHSINPNKIVMCALI